MINRDNYEEYFLLYVDNELTVVERKAVEQFIDDNADLQRELTILQQLRLKPEQNIFFVDKDRLFRRHDVASTINHNNYEEFFLLYADNELNADEKKMVEEFVIDNQTLRQEFELLLITQVGPDYGIVFPDKEILYKKPQRRVVFLPWVRIAAAAIVLLLLGLFVFNNSGKTLIPSVSKTADSKISDTNYTADGNKDLKRVEPAVTSSSHDSLNIARAVIKKLTASSPVKKINDLKNRSVAVKKNKLINQRVPLITIDSSAQIVAAKISRPIQKVTLEAKQEILPPSISYSAAGIVSFGGADSNSGADGVAPHEDIPFVTNTSTKKNRFRGFFRKVSRAFNKTAHVENENSDAVLIGSFRIALK